ncbi:TPA: hypothetical protein ACVT70_003643 [Clostridioides difficile]
MSENTYLIKSDGSKEFIDNSIKNISESKILIDKQYIDFLIKSDIPYFIFSDYLENCYMVPRGNRKKRFNFEEIKLIKSDLETMPIREVAKKHNCSVNIVQNIKLNRY